MSDEAWHEMIDGRDAIIAARDAEVRHLRDAIVSARWRLAKGRALWNGPCHECDAVLESALRIVPDEGMASEGLNTDTDQSLQRYLNSHD